MSTTAITITPGAQDRVRTIITDAARDVGADDFVLRLLVEAGGCAGFSYRLSIVTEGELEGAHARFPQDGFDLAVPADAVPLVDGLTIDFVETLTQAGFSFHNTRAASSCGCGESFAPGEDAVQALADQQLSAKIIDVLGDIRPYLQNEGGDVEFAGVRDGVVQVRLEGACGGCSMATMTLNNVIQRRLQEALPEVREVVTVP